MPEGDTVFLAGRRLHNALAGKVLVRGELRHPDLSTVDLAGSTVLEVRSVGKHLFIALDDGRSLHSHLRMDGAWHLYQPNEPWRGPAHEVRAVLATADRVAVGFRLHDLRLLLTAEEASLVGHLGPDLLDPGWNDEHEAEAVRRLVAEPGRELGVALLDQTVMAGVGNLYKNEICFMLRLNPWLPVREVNAAAVVRLARKLLWRNAWRPEQSTTGELRRGSRHWVYQRGGQPCRRCGTLIRSAPEGEDVRERTTYFCPHCQPAGPVSGG